MQGDTPYRMEDVDAMTLDDVDRMNEIFKSEDEKETTIDKAFPFLF